MKPAKSTSEQLRKMRQLQRGPEHSPLWSPSLIKQSLFVSLNERHRYQMLRVWSEHLVACCTSEI